MTQNSIPYKQRARVGLAMAFMLVASTLFVVAVLMWTRDLRHGAWVGVGIWTVPMLLALSATVRGLLMLRGEPAGRRNA